MSIEMSAKKVCRSVLSSVSQQVSFSISIGCK